MSRIQSPPVADIEYPESDGKPMGETDLHRNWMMRLYDMLHYHFRNERVYVASDLLLYYEEGEVQKFIVPDIFVVKDSEPEFRRTFRTWDEGRIPNMVIEVTSKSTRREDELFKPHRYEMIGVPELFLYDPTGDYLTPRLQGYRLQNDGYARIEPDSADGLESEELGLQLSLKSSDLILRDRSTGNVLPTEAEAERTAREAERAAREAAEAEVQRLREQLKRLGGSEA
jgi:Uma2 family endonuclease